MATAFALAYAEQRAPEPETPFTFDPARQLNVCMDGSLAAENFPMLLVTSTTQSTAGSKTHNDDA
jgi:putative ATP-grasp target RiPP